MKFTKHIHIGGPWPWTGTDLYSNKVNKSARHQYILDLTCPIIRRVPKRSSVAGRRHDVVRLERRRFAGTCPTSRPVSDDGSESVSDLDITSY